jgi:hypothetical protein
MPLNMSGTTSEVSIWENSRTLTASPTQINYEHWQFS